MSVASAFFSDVLSSLSGVMADLLDSVEVCGASVESLAVLHKKEKQNVL